MSIVLILSSKVNPPLQHELEKTTPSPRAKADHVTIIVAISLTNNRLYLE